MMSGYMEAFFPVAYVGRIVACTDMHTGISLDRDAVGWWWRIVIPIYLWLVFPLMYDAIYRDETPSVPIYAYEEDKYLVKIIIVKWGEMPADYVLISIHRCRSSLAFARTDNL
ncbi:hypothetical protein ACH5RR_018848 [Cinchona calisaya]|uniref:Uncharacterized protein n=1 Tax=Cinchona calisaya TaxID=153742 RepID=A0ABD2ZNJ0_9GENT